MQGLLTSRVQGGLSPRARKKVQRLGSQKMLTSIQYSFFFFPFSFLIGVSELKRQKKNLVS